jgi:hypothetical protein
LRGPNFKVPPSEYKEDCNACACRLSLFNEHGKACFAQQLVTGHVAMFSYE